MFSSSKINLFSLLMLLLTFTIVSAQEKITIGDQRVLHSQILNENRKIQVYLPPSYNNHKIQKAQYPVIYLLDGESNFNYFAGFIEKLSQGPYAYIPEMIVIGIVNTERTRDLTPTIAAAKETAKVDTQKSGGNDRFFSFLQNELFDWVEREYRVENYKILVGHSFGGLTALNALFHHTNLFNAYIVHDPSLWWDQQVMLEKFEKQKNKDFNNRILYLTQAGESFNNTGLQEHFLSNKKFQKMLDQTPFTNLSWQYKSYENEDHGSIPIPGNLDGLRYIFKGHQINIKAIATQPDLIPNTYASLSQSLGYPFQPTETYIDKVAQYLLKNNQKEQALLYFQQNAVRFPSSPQAHYSLYEYYTQTDQHEPAQAHLNQALELGYSTK